MDNKLSFASDYMRGCHPAILQKLNEINLVNCDGYGFDHFCSLAREKILNACGIPDGDVFFLAGGTQTNKTVIDAMLRPYQGVLAADTGHISSHEAGAIEYGGHKVLTLPHKNGKIDAAAVRKYAKIYYADPNHDHMVMPGMVYISQPTEYGTIYSLKELSALSDVCHEYGLKLYLDGARLAYALACRENDAGLADIARLCDAFYIGGTKCGALFGEALVFPKHNEIPHFFSIIKQHGALLAKGFVAGIQFDTLFSDDLYNKIGSAALKAAERIKAALKNMGFKIYIDSPTNQIFVLFEDRMLKALSETVELSFWEKPDDSHTVMRIATSWSTTDEDVNMLVEQLRKISGSFML